MPNPDLLTPQQVAEILQLTTETLRNWRDSGSGPPFERLNGRVIRYERAALEQWRESRRVSPESGQ